jgi:hypothetical protein
MAHIFLYRVRKNPTLKPHEVIGEHHNKDSVSRNYLSEMLPCSATDRQIGSKVENQNKPLKYSEKNLFRTNLEQMFESTATDLHTQPIMAQQRVSCVLKNARLLPDGCCCLNSTGSRILFGINWWRVNQGVVVASRKEAHWCEVRWPGRPSHRSAPSSPAIVVSSGEMLILKRIQFPLSLRQQQPSGDNLAFLSAYFSCCRLHIEQYFWTSAINWYEIQLFFIIRQRFCWIPNLVRPNLTVRSTAWSYLRLSFFVLVPPITHEVWPWSFSAPYAPSV